MNFHIALQQTSDSPHAVCFLNFFWSLTVYQNLRRHLWEWPNHTMKKIHHLFVIHLASASKYEVVLCFQSRTTFSSAFSFTTLKKIYFPVIPFVEAQIPLFLVFSIWRLANDQTKTFSIKVLSPNIWVHRNRAAEGGAYQTRFWVM